MTNPRAVLQREAEARGFLVAWAPVALPDSIQEGYRQWIAAGRFATMGGLARALDIRLAPRERLAWARSVMVLAAPHAFPDPGVPEGGVRIGRVGRIFWIREHDFIRRLIWPHIEELKDLCYTLGGRCRDYIEQGPLSFRSYAALAGLGWIGRNGMLLRPARGTYLTLAVLLTNFEVEPPPPHPNRCGECTLCVQKCPTGALIGDGVLDANRCISYWTTKHPGLIPIEVWPGIGNWLYGCDLCQEVCPWNHSAEAFWHEYQPEPELAHPDVTDFLTLSERAFRAKYVGSDFERFGRVHMARNALIVLSNTKDSSYLPLIRRGTQDRAPLVRATAAWALARMGNTRPVEKLLEDPDTVVQHEARQILEVAELGAFPKR